MPSPSKRRRGSSWIWVVGAVCFVGGGAAFHLLAPKVEGWLGGEAEDGNEVSSQGAGSRERVSALGTIEPAGGLIELAGPPGDRVFRINVKVGDEVKKGDELARLESYALREAELARLKATRTDAETQYASTKESGELRITQLEGQIPQLKKAQELEDKLQTSKIELLSEQLIAARKYLARLESVGRTVPEVQKEQQRLQIQQLEGELGIARDVQQQQRKKAEQDVKDADAELEAARKELTAKLSAVPSKEALDAQEELANLQLEQSVIRAPADGTVLQVFAQVGEPTGTGPLMQMADLGEMVIRAEVYEDDVPTVRNWTKGPGVNATATNRALQAALPGEKGQLNGEVNEPIGRVVGRNRVMPLDPVADADRRVVEVRVALDEDSDASDFVGMQVNVTLTPAK